MSKKLHKEKCIFEVALSGLRKIKDKSETGELTKKEENLQSYLVEQLWNMVYLYGLSLAHSMLSSYPMSPRDYQEVQSDLYIAFMENLYNYTPDYTFINDDGIEQTVEIAPTTYFKPHFRGAIRKYILDRFHKVKQYDANNIRKVNKAIQYYDTLGVRYTPQLIAQRTKLSVKVVEQTMEVILRSQNVNLDDIYDVKGATSSPEHEFIQKERDTELYSLLEAKLSASDYELFITWANPSGSNALPYETVASMMNKDSAEVRQELNRIIITLSEDSDLQLLKGPAKRKRRKGFDTNLHIKEEQVSPLSVYMRPLG